MYKIKKGKKMNKEEKKFNRQLNWLSGCLISCIAIYAICDIIIVVLLIPVK